MTMKQKRLRNGLYVIRHNGYYVIIYNVDRNKWQAYLPSGFFANSTTKKSCILNVIYEIDNTDNFACDEKAKKENWWITDEHFK